MTVTAYAWSQSTQFEKRYQKPEHPLPSRFWNSKLAKLHVDPEEEATKQQHEADMHGERDSIAERSSTESRAELLSITVSVSSGGCRVILPPAWPDAASLFKAVNC
jgi:hypothetical protein